MHLLESTPLKDLVVSINQKPWGIMRKIDDAQPAWEALMGARLWKSDEYEKTRERLRKMMTQALEVDPGRGVDCKVLHLTQGEMVDKVVGYGKMEALLKWAPVQAVFIEVAHEEELEDDVYAVLLEENPFVIFGGQQTVEKIGNRLHELGRSDLTRIHIIQGWPKDEVEFAPKEDWWKAPLKAAILGGYPLSHSSIFPWTQNFDMAPPALPYAEYHYLLEVMKTPLEVHVPQQGMRSRILLRPHPDRSALAAINLAVMLCGGDDCWVVSVIVDGDVPEGFGTDVAKAYEGVLAARGRLEWAMGQFLRGDVVRTKSYAELEQKFQEGAKKRLAEMKSEAEDLKKAEAKGKVKARQVVEEDPEEAEVVDEEMEEIEEILETMPRETVEDRRERLRALERLSKQKVQAESAKEVTTRSRGQATGQSESVSSGKGRKRPTDSPDPASKPPATRSRRLSGLKAVSHEVV